MDNSEENTTKFYFEQGQEKFKNNDYKGAIEDFDKAIELNPDSAYLYEQRGDVKSSLESFYGAISDHDYDAIIDYNKAIELDSRNKVIYNKRGVLKSILSDYRGAIDDFSKAIDIDPEFVQAQENLEEAKTWLNDFNNRIKYQQHVINKLENIDKNAELQLTMVVGNGVYESVSVNGKWFDDKAEIHTYDLDCVMEWNYGEFSCETVVEDLIILLKEKTLRDINQDDWELELNETTDGNLDVKKIYWDGELNEELDKKFNENEIEDYEDLYNDGYIDDSEYYFKGLYSIEIESVELGISESITSKYWNNDLDLGKEKLKNKDYKGVIDHFSKVIEFDKKNAEVYLNLGNAKSELKDFEGAIEDFSKLIELNPNSKLGFYNRGLAKNALKDHQGAIEDFTKLIEIHSDSAEPYLQRGQAKNELKDYQGAIEDFNKTIEINPNNEGAYQQRGKAKSSLEDYLGAVEDYSKAIEFDSDFWVYYSGRGDAKRNLKDYKGAIEDYNKLIELNPNYKWAYQERGKSKSNLEDYQGAIEDFSKVIEIDPNYKWAYQERGQSKSNLEDYPGAIEDFSKVIEIDPNYKWAYQERGESKNKLEDYQGAIEDFNKVIEIDPGYKWAYEPLGIAKSKLKDYQGAIEDFNNAIEKGAKWSSIYYNRGLAKHDLKDYKGALEDYHCVSQGLLRDIHLWYNIELAKSKLENYRDEIENLKVDARDPNYVNAYFNRAKNVWEPLGLREKEIEDLNKVIEIDSKHLLAYQNRGQAKSGLKDCQGALKDFSKALKLDPDNDIKYWLYIYIGGTELKLNDFHAAIENYSKAIEIDPKNEWAYKDRGAAKSSLKDYQGAIEDFDKVIELAPDHEAAYEERDKARKFLNESGDLNAAKELNPDEKLNKKHKSLDNNKGNRTKRLSELGIQMAIKALENNGFNNIKDYTVEKRAFPFVNLYAERDGKNYVINVKARNKFQKDLKENLYFNVGKKGHENAQKASDEFNAEAYWMAIPFDQNNYAVYFGSMQELNFKNAISIKKCKNGKIGTILTPESSHNQDWDLFENEKI